MYYFGFFECHSAFTITSSPAKHTQALRTAVSPAGLQSQSYNEDCRLPERDGTEAAEQTTIDTDFFSLKQPPPFHWQKNDLIFVTEYYFLFQGQFVLIIFYLAIKAKHEKSQHPLKENLILYLNLCFMPNYFIRWNNSILQFTR